MRVGTLPLVTIPSKTPRRFTIALRPLPSKRALRPRSAGTSMPYPPSRLNPKLCAKPSQRRGRRSEKTRISSTTNAGAERRNRSSAHYGSSLFNSSERQPPYSKRTCTTRTGTFFFCPNRTLPSPYPSSSLLHHEGIKAPSSGR